MKIPSSLKLVLFSASLAANFYFIAEHQKMNEEKKVHTLKAPMVFETSSEHDPYYLLPAGTNLYFDKAFPEGHVRYIAYLNYKGPELELHTPEKPNLIDPAWIRQIEKSELGEVLNKYPLSKADLEKILHATSISREELIEVINNYLTK